MNCRRFVLAAGAVVGAGLGAAIFTGPAAYAVDGLTPPGDLEVGGPTDVIFDYSGTGYDFRQATTPFNVLDDNNNIVGTYNETDTHFGIPFVSYSHDVIADGTGSVSAWTGAVDESFSWVFPTPLLGYFTIFDNDYLSTPEGASDYLTLFNVTFPLFDTFPDDMAQTAAASSLADLSQLLDAV